MNLFNRGLAIDLGTANTLIYPKGKGIVLDEPSVITISGNDKKVKAARREAKKMYGKATDFIKTLRPIKDGVISDVEVTQQMINTFILRALKRKPLRRIEMLICVRWESKKLKSGQ